MAVSATNGSPSAAAANGSGNADAARASASNPITVRLARPTVRGLVRAVLILTLLAILLYLTWRVRGVLRLASISVFFALALMPVVDAVSSKVRMPRALVILSVYVALIAVVAVIGYVVVPSLVKDVQQFSHDAPTYAHDLRTNATFRHYELPQPRLIALI